MNRTSFLSIFSRSIQFSGRRRNVKNYTYQYRKCTKTCHYCLMPADQYIKYPTNTCHHLMNRKQCVNFQKCIKKMGSIDGSDNNSICECLDIN